MLLIGPYYIDPNGGSIEDAMEVQCYRIELIVWTCIEPKQDIYVRSIYWLVK